MIDCLIDLLLNLQNLRLPDKNIPLDSIEGGTQAMFRGYIIMKTWE